MADLEGTIESCKPIAAVPPKEVDLRAWRQPLAGAAIVAVLFIWLFGNWFRSQWGWATREVADWGHTLVIPFISGYFIYLNREKLLAKPFRTTWLGLVPIVFGIGWYVLTTVGPPAIRHFNLQAAGLWATLVGLALLFLGWRAMTWLWFPLVYLFVFGQTISKRFLEIITFQMQDITAVGAYYVLGLGTNVELQGNTIFIISGNVTKPLNIAEACSGMRMLMAFAALGVAMAYTGLPRLWQRTLLVLMAVPTAVAVNILRVVTLGILSLYDSELAGGDFHSFVGLVWLVPAFLIYLGLMWIIKHLVIEEPTARGRGG